MKKRILALMAVLALLFCTGCTPQTEPDPEVEAFLNTGIDAQKAYEAVAKVEYTVRQSEQNKAGEELGGYELHVKIDKSNADALHLEYEQTFFGNAIQNGIERKQASITLVDGKYIYTTVNGEETKQEEPDEKFVQDYITSFFYMDNGAYNEGGLYFGDFFMLYIYKYPASSFSVDKESNQCVFDEKIHIQNEQTGDVRLYQTTKINPYGLLDSNFERYESVDEDMVLLSELKATYVFA